MEYMAFMAEAYKAINEALYYGSLPEVINGYLAQETASGALGVYVSPEKNYLNRGEHGIVLNERSLSEAVEDGDFVNMYMAIIDTMAHEVVHYWCNLNGIRDVEKSGNHTKLFRVAALAHGLDCKQSRKGYAATRISVPGWLALKAVMSDEALSDCGFEV